MTMRERYTIRDVAALAGVSNATVSYVLSGKKKISEETRQRVLRVIEEVGFVPDLNARGLSGKDTKLIGIVIPQTEPGSRLMFHNTFYSELLGSIEFATRRKGYHVLISATDMTQDYLNLIKERNLAGVIIVGTYESRFWAQLKKLEVPVVCLSQLSRANEKREDKRPMLSDLRDSGAIEQDADIVMFLYREDYYKEETENRNIAECIVAKNRHGETGKVPLRWTPEYTAFSTVELRFDEDE